MSDSNYIQSTQNPRIKDAVKLRNTSSKDSGLILIEGQREVKIAMSKGLEPATVFISTEPPAGVNTERDAKLREAVIKYAMKKKAEIFRVSETAYAKIAMRESHAGAILIAKRPKLISLESILKKPNSLVLICEGVEKPGNLGALMRSADGAGVDAVIITDGRVDPFNPNVLRASAGTALTHCIVEAQPSQLRDSLVNAGFQVVAASPQTTKSYFEINYNGKCAIILGTEAEGLSANWNHPQVKHIKIPMAGVADSLNVSVAGAILLYEAIRQRRAFTSPNPTPGPQSSSIPAPCNT